MAASHLTTPLALLVGTAVAAGAGFSMDAMAAGYQQAPAKTASEGKCGEGKCGAAMHGDAAGKDKANASAKAHHTFEGLDSDRDARVSRSEFAAAHGGKDTKFAGIDTDGDGFISKAEFDAHHAAMGKAGAEGKCGADHEGHGDAHDKAAAGEGKCGEGKCGEGKCGGSI